MLEHLLISLDCAYHLAFPSRMPRKADVVVLRFSPRLVPLAFYVSLRQHLQFLHGHVGLRPYVDTTI